MKSPRIVLLLLLLSPLAACSSEDAGPRHARVVIITDTHVIGPQYTTPVENSPADNTSILLAPDRLRSIRDQVNAMEPLPDAVIVLGDVVHAAHHSTDVEWYAQNESAFSVAKEIFDGFDVPVHVLMGNHDYEMDCDGEDYPRALSEELFRRFFGAEPYYDVEYGGAHFYLLNGQQGPTWDVTSPDCNTENASFGPDQLAWLDEALDDGKPAIVMSHYMGFLWAHQENPSDPARADLETVLDAHSNVAMYLGGHTHRWLDFSMLFNHPHYVVGPSRYDDDNFWLLELDPTQGTITILDRDKAIWGNSCAQTWSYDPGPMSVEGAEEMGTCVMGIE